MTDASLDLLARQSDLLDGRFTRVERRLGLIEPVA